MNSYAGGNRSFPDGKAPWYSSSYEFADLAYADALLSSNQDKQQDNDHSIPPTNPASRRGARIAHTTAEEVTPTQRLPREHRLASSRYPIDQEAYRTYQETSHHCSPADVKLLRGVGDHLNMDPRSP